MSRLQILAIALTMFVFSVGARAGCAYPEQLADLPDGKTASEEEMIVTQRAVQAYVQNMEAYLACLDTEFEARGEAASEEYRIIRDKRHNAAIDAMEAIAGDFNLAVREYKGRD